MEVQLRIYNNSITVVKGDEQTTVMASEPFSTDRLLVGNFDSAWKCVEQAAKELKIIGFLKRKSKVVVEPKELIEGGVSQVEARVFRELALALNPKNVEISV